MGGLGLALFVVSWDLVWGDWHGLVGLVMNMLRGLGKFGVKYGVGWVLAVVMASIMAMNLYGLLGEIVSMYYPYIMMVTAGLWVVLVVDDMVFSVKFLPHFVPMGVGLGMGVVLSLLELVSHLIRPLTLCVRLSTNITAGHVMMTMLSLFCSGSFLMWCVLFVGVVLVVVLEVVVALLQAYIYSSLLSLYHSEFV
uniref:ATP synthase subunit a n=1 Tax=Oncicola luehei TaxID=1100885 RepID=H2E2D6_9BILA|nr:ATP synthase F0 subunit 6 [Oncicola luehei]AER42896.1 ATP Synthase F0 subunit 6 [Oncicola luehei]